MIKHIPSAYEGCPHYKMCKGTACVTEKRYVIDAVAAVSVKGTHLIDLQRSPYYKLILNSFVF